MLLGVSTRTVDWTASRPGEAGPSTTEGLRERKKRLLRQQLSDTATELFMARGFDAVRVTEVAQACGVSEKTVYNYFPTKESLVLDRGDATLASLRTGLADPGIRPVEATLRILDQELHALMSWLAGQDDPVKASATILRFGQLIRATPSLRAYQRDMTDRLIAVSAQILAERAGLDPDDPEPRFAATAQLGLWDAQFRSLHRNLGGARTPEQVTAAVTADVRRAARVLNAGLAALLRSDQ
jgi:AcrR family transcriptional regulator